MVTTHELGHNFGAEHDQDNIPDCAPREDQGGKYVMYPIAVSGDHVNNKVRGTILIFFLDVSYFIFSFFRFPFLRQIVIMHFSQKQC